MKQLFLPISIYIHFILIIKITNRNKIKLKHKSNRTSTNKLMNPLYKGINKPLFVTC